MYLVQRIKSVTKINFPSRSWKRKDSFDCEKLPCREVGHEELRDQFLEKNCFLYMLRATDMFILHCSQHAVLHVKVVNVTSVLLLWLLRTQGSADGARSVLLHQEASVTFSGCQSFNTRSWKFLFSFLNLGLLHMSTELFQSVRHKSDNCLWKMEKCITSAT